MVSDASPANSLIVVKSVVPNVANISEMPIDRPMSPTRLTMKAFLAAAAAECLCCQNPISRYDARPTPSQPRNRTRKLAAQHQHQHRRDEQVEVAEEADPARVVLHVADRVDVDQRADAGDQQQEQCRQRVVEQVEVDLQAARLEPGEQVLGDLAVLAVAAEQLDEQQQADQERADRQRATEPGTPAVEAATAQRAADEQDQGAQSGQRDDQPEQREDAVGRPRVDHRDAFVLGEHQVSASRTSAGWRRRPRPNGACGRWS